MAPGRKMKAPKAKAQPSKSPKINAPAASILKPIKATKRHAGGGKRLSELVAATEAQKAGRKKERRPQGDEDEDEDDYEPSEVDDEQEKKDIRRMKETAVQSDEESEGEDAHMEIEEEGEYEEELDDKGQVVKKPINKRPVGAEKTAKEKEDEEKMKAAMRKRAIRAATRVQQITDRIDDDNVTPYDIRDEDIDPKTLIAPDAGGIYQLTPHLDGNIIADEQRPGIYRNTMQSKEYYRESRTQECPHCKAFMPRDSQQCAALACRRWLPIHGTFDEVIEKVWYCEECGERNRSNRAVCWDQDCKATRAWSCTSCEATSITTAECTCKRGYRPLLEGEEYKPNVAPMRLPLVHRIKNPSDDEGDGRDDGRDDV